MITLNTTKILVSTLLGLLFLALAIFSAWSSAQCGEGKNLWVCDNIPLVLVAVIGFGILGALFLGNAVGDFILRVLGQPITHMPRWTFLPIIVAAALLFFFLFFFLFQ